MIHTWKDRAGNLDLHATVHVRSTGSHDDSEAGREVEHVEEREIVDVEIGGITFCAGSRPTLFCELVALLQPDVDGAAEDAFEWEESE